MRGIVTMIWCTLFSVGSSSTLTLALFNIFGALSFTSSTVTFIVAVAVWRLENNHIKYIPVNSMYGIKDLNSSHRSLFERWLMKKISNHYFLWRKYQTTIFSVTVCTVLLNKSNTTLPKTTHNLKHTDIILS